MKINLIKKNNNNNNKFSPMIFFSEITVGKTYMKDLFLI